MPLPGVVRLDAPYPPDYPSGPFSGAMVSPLFTILTLFPEALRPYLEVGVLGNALDRGLAQVELVDFRDWTRDRHRTVDDRPFGGGPGMVLTPEPIAECIEWVEAKHGPHRRFVLDPSGPTFNQARAAQFSSTPRSLLLCGRYEGIDQRLIDIFDLEPLSLGNYVLSGGELPALSIVDAAVRLLPGALGDERSASQDSFQEEPGNLVADPGDGLRLDHPHWTRPASWRGQEVPAVLRTGDHSAIETFRKSQAQERSERKLALENAPLEHTLDSSGAQISNKQLPNKTT